MPCYVFFLSKVLFKPKRENWYCRLKKNKKKFEQKKKSLKKQGSCHERQKPQAPTPQAPICNRQTRKVAYAKVLNRNSTLT